MSDAHLSYVVVASPLGELRVVSSERGLCRLDFMNEQRSRASVIPLQLHGDHDEARAHLTLFVHELYRFFEKECTQFTVKLDLSGHTPFRQLVWGALQEIPFGKTYSYKDQALAIGKPMAMRAVGQANHHNPLAIIIPCHRIIGADGSLVGYGGGLWRKQWLLRHEGAL